MHHALRAMYIPFDSSALEWLHIPAVESSLQNESCGLFSMFLQTKSKRPLIPRLSVPSFTPADRPKIWSIRLNRIL